MFMFRDYFDACIYYVCLNSDKHAYLLQLPSVLW